MRFTVLLYPLLVFMMYLFSSQTPEYTSKSDVQDSSILEDPALKPFALFPNPAEQAVKIKSPYFSKTGAKLFIYNASGEKVLGITKLEFDTNHETNIDIAGIDSGLYFVQLRYGNYSATKKLIKLN